MHIHYLRFSLIPYRLLFSPSLSLSSEQHVPSVRPVWSMRTLSLPFSLSPFSSLSLFLPFPPFPPALRRCISSADESSGSETEYGIAEGGRPIERARGMQSERSCCCHVTERARARAHDRERTRQRMDNFSETDVLVRSRQLLLILLSSLFLRLVLSLLAAYPTLLIRVYAAFAGSSSLASREHTLRANSNESHLRSSLFSFMSRG